MRNLKKILALVLALVMSLSLMATASAADFKDASDISENYQTAVNVLEGLKVFKGYAEDNTFRPKGEITRAEVATIIYRIATGDAEDKQASIYTNMTTSFTDLDKAEWARGYVNYCHNAQIIKGESATKFNPNGKITGYATLAMILRAMGYGKNGEFEGAQWEYQTAAKAKEIGLIDNVIEAQLGSNAPRELVAEILFRALLTNMVDYTVLNGYQTNGKTLGQQQFGLEKVEGVVMANEWANLKENGTKVLAAGKTDIKIAKVQNVGATVEVGKTYTLDYTTDLDAVGLNHTAYIANKTGDKQVLTMEATGNDVKYNEGASKTVDNLRDGLTLNNDTEWFKNYAQEWDDNATSDYLIRYAVSKAAVDADDDWEEFLNVTVKDTVTTRKVRVTTLNASGVVVEADVDCYVRSIQPGKTITVIDQEIMQSIFYTADRLVNSNDVTNVQDYVYGEVYVGTASTKDVSDTMSWVGFKADYFTVDVNSRKFASVPNGDSLRIVDNDGDGVAEYVLWVAYTQAKAVDTVDGGLLFSRNNGSSGLRMADYTDNNLNANDELALGDIANYYVIDKKLSIWKADVLTSAIKTKNFKDVTVTLSDDTVKGQSGIVNATTLDDSIMKMSDKPEYNMYLDEYGYIRTYELAEGKKYTLLTEMYGGTTNNYNYIENSRWIAEMKAGDSALVERQVANPAGNPFISNVSAAGSPLYVWTSRAQTTNGSVSWVNNPNYLQPATAHLGINTAWASALLGGTTYAPVNGTATGSGLYRDNAWGRTVYQVGTPAMFNFGPVTYNTNPSGTAVAETTTPNSFSFTNVAVYTLEDEAVNLETASKLHTNTAGEQLYRSRVANVAGQAIGTLKTEAEWKDAYKATDRTLTQAQVDAWWTARLTAWDLYRVYETDYIQLKAEDYAAGKRHYDIAADYANKYITLSNSYVDATVNTEYYIVSPNNVRYVVGYDALYAIKADTVRAAYAVAQNTAKDANGQDYWVADVIVIEVNEITSDYDNLGLIYYNPWETSGQVRNVSELNNQWRALQPDYDGLAKMDVVPSTSTGGPSTWGNVAWGTNSYGFYRQYDTAPKSDTNGNMTAGNVTQITKEFNSYGIYAGTVKRIPTIYETSNYIDIALDGGAAANTPASLVKAITVNGGSYKTPVYRMDRATSGVTTASTINLLNDPSLDPAGSVQIGDPVIVVYDNSKGGQVAYIVDLVADLNRDGNNNVDWNVPTWLVTLYNTIIAEQTKTSPDYGFNLTVTTKGLPANLAYTKTFKIPTTDAATLTYTMTNPEFVVGGYRVKAIVDKTATVLDATGTDVTVRPTLTQPAVGGAVGQFVIPALCTNNIAVELEYEVAQYTLTLDGAGFTTGVTVNNDGTVLTTAMNAFATNKPGVYKNNEQFIVTVPKSAGKYYTATVTPASGVAEDLTVANGGRKVNADGSTTFTGTMTRDLTIKITETDNATTLALTGTAGAGNWAALNVQYSINGVLQMNGAVAATLANGDTITSAAPDDKVNFTVVGADGTAKKAFVLDEAVNGGLVCTTRTPIDSYLYTEGTAADALTFYEPISVEIINSITTGNTLDIAVSKLGNQILRMPIGNETTVTKATILVPYGEKVTGTWVATDVTGSQISVEGPVGTTVDGGGSTVTTAAINAAGTFNFTAKANP